MRFWSLLLGALLLASLPVSADLAEATAAGEVSVQLVGDGKSSLRTQMVLTNLTSEPVTFTVEAGTVFQAAERQSLIVLKARDVTLPPGASARSTVPTLCLGSRSESPATEEPAAYRCSGPTDAPQDALQLVRVARSLKAEGRYPALPLPPALEAQLVAQLAYWASQGDLVRGDVREEAVRQMGLDEKSMTPEQKQELDQGVDNIWEAVDLTLKGAS